MAEGNIPRPFSTTVISIVQQTTDANGIITTNLNRDDYLILDTKSGGIIVTPFVQTASDGGKICLKCIFPNTYSPCVNTTIGNIALIAYRL